MSDNSSGGNSTAIVAIVAIIVILGVGYFVAQKYMVKDGSPSINVELPTQPNN